MLPKPLLVGESPMLNDHLLDFSNAIWKDTDWAQHGGVIFNTPCRLHRPPCVRACVRASVRVGV